MSEKKVLASRSLSRCLCLGLALTRCLYFMFCPDKMSCPHTLLCARDSYVGGNGPDGPQGFDGSQGNRGPTGAGCDGIVPTDGVCVFVCVCLCVCVFMWWCRGCKHDMTLACAEPAASYVARLVLQSIGVYVHILCLIGLYVHTCPPCCLLLSCEVQLAGAR